MKKILLILLLFVSVTCFSQVPMYKQFDKQIHFSAGTVAATLGYAAGYNLTHSKFKASLIAIGTSVLVGTLKETYDYFDYGKFDNKDLLATSLGSIPVVLTATIIIHEKQNRKRIRKR